MTNKNSQAYRHTQNELDNIFNIAKTISISAKRMTHTNPYVTLEQMLKIILSITNDNKKNQGAFALKTEIASISLKRHQNLITSYVSLWLGSEKRSQELKHLRERLVPSQQAILDKMTDAMLTIQANVPQGYRTPLILLDYLWHHHDQLAIPYKKAFQQITSDDNSMLTALWLKEVASWQD